VLLVAAGLFLKSLRNVSRAELGLSVEHVATFTISPVLNGYAHQRGRQLINRVDEELATMPGVSGVTSARVALFDGVGWGSGITVEGIVTDPAVDHDAMINQVGPQFFRTLGIPLLSGRDFTEEDDANRTAVALISAPLARKLFPDRSPLGERLLIDDSDADPRPVQIVGVVGDVKQEKLEAQPAFDIYLPWRQVISEAVPWLRSTSFLVFRTSMPPMSLEAAVRKEIYNLDPTIPTTNIRSMEQVMGGALAARRFSLSLVGIFAVTALLLAAAALYAVIAYGIEQRTREIGVRMALGASRLGILQMIMSEGFRLVATGMVLGFLAAIPLANLIATQLYGVSTRDPLTYAIVLVALSVAALFASYFAARRAMHLDPMVALRHE